MLTQDAEVVLDHEEQALQQATCEAVAFADGVQFRNVDETSEMKRQLTKKRTLKKLEVT